MQFGFRRATHTVDGRYKDEFFSERNLTGFQKLVWREYGDIVHLLHSNKVISYSDILDEIRKDQTNFFYRPSDLNEWRDGSPMPTPEKVALALVRLAEAGYIEVLSLEA